MKIMKLKMKKLKIIKKKLINMKKHSKFSHYFCSNTHKIISKKKTCISL